MLAIIIVAMFIILIAIGSYVVWRLKLLGEKERNFYDIFALIHFCMVIERFENWTEFIKNTETIFVTRSLMKKEDVEEEEVVLLATDSEMIACFDFCYEEQIQTIYLTVPKIHQKKANMLFKGTFKCEIEPRKLKMLLTGSFEQKIFIISFQTAYQTLFLQLESERMDFRERYGKYMEYFKEISETQKWVEHQLESLRKHY